MMLLKVQLLNSRKRSQHTGGENGMKGIYIYMYIYIYIFFKLSYNLSY